MSKFYLLIFLFFSALASSATTYTVTDTTANSTSSLAYAIAQANANLGRDTIEFNIPGTLTRHIVTDSLPDITDPVFINGLSQPGNTATDFYNTNLLLQGTRGISIHSPDCEILGIEIVPSGVSQITGIDLVADSAKSVSNTIIRRTFFWGVAIGISFHSDSIFSLNSTQIQIDGVHFWVCISGLKILPSLTCDFTDVAITNCEFHSAPLIINRQHTNPSIPNYSIHDNFIEADIHLEGYLDSIYIGYNTIEPCIFLVTNCSMNNSSIEHNQITTTGACSNTQELVLQDFIGNSIKNIRIQYNDFEDVDVHFDFSGTGQIFDSIFFRWNTWEGMELFFEKNNINNVDTQRIHNFYVTGNTYTVHHYPVDLNFFFSGKSEIENLHVDYNQELYSSYPSLKLTSDTLTHIKKSGIKGNAFSSNSSPTIDLHLGGSTDSLRIEKNSIAFDPHFGDGTGILFSSYGEIANFSIDSNQISLGALSGWSLWSPVCNGITIKDLHRASGEIKHNQIHNCLDAGIVLYSNPDSDYSIEIDSNIISSCFGYYGIGILSAPYNPPTQNIGTYTMLGNSIYNIGQEGIYRYSQHDTASCMTCIPKPQLLTAEYNGGITSVTGSLTGDTLTDYIIEYFSNTAPDTGGYTEGKFFIYRDTITTDATGNAVFVTDIPGNYLNAFITSTAISMTTYQTSEFSNEAGVVMGVGEVTVANDVLIFPNPVIDKLYVHSTSGKEMQIEILDPLGNIVLDRSLSSSALITLDVSNLTTGLYFVKMKYDGAAIVLKFIKS